MSREALVGVAAQWGCSVDEAIDRIVAKLKMHGLVSADSERQPVGSADPARLIRVGVEETSGGIYIEAGEDHWIPIEAFQ